MLTVLLASLVQWSFAGLVATFQVALAAQQHGCYLVVAHFARQVEWRHLVGAQCVHIRNEIAV